MGNLADDGNGFDFTRDDSYRFYLITRDAAWIEKQAARGGEQRGDIPRQQAMGSRGLVAKLFDVITRAKVRRLARDLAIRGVCYDRASNSRISAVSIDSIVTAIEKANAVPSKPANASFHATTHRQSFAGILRRAIGSLANFLFPEWGERAGNYQPERHYMRGPGPKWREKQAPYQHRGQ